MLRRLDREDKMAFGVEAGTATRFGSTAACRMALDQKVRTVSENASALKYRASEFAEE